MGLTVDGISGGGADLALDSSRWIYLASFQLSEAGGEVGLGGRRSSMFCHTFHCLLCRGIV